jgi:hypothetical protein
MTFNVEMLAFGKGEIRPVDVPEDQVSNILENDLEIIFRYGQNDFQNLPFPSVSAGDIIHYKEQKYLVAGIGFKKMSEAEYQNYLTMAQRDRSWLAYIYRPENN